MASLLSLKVGVLSFSVVVCAAMVLKLSLPAVTEFANSELPSIWSNVMTWLRPPYLYVVINGIIITIVASSKLQNHKAYDADSPPETLVVPPVPVAVVHGGVKEAPDLEVEIRPEYDDDDDADVVKVPEYDGVLPEEETKYMTSAVSPGVADAMTTLATLDANATDGRFPRSVWTPERNSSSVSTYEKPSVWARMGHRKAMKSEGGRALRVSKPKRQETLETTWKTITEGRPMPLNRHLGISNSWETHGNHHLPQEPDPKMMTLETFHNHTSTTPSGGHVDIKASPLPGLGKLRKEPSGSWKLKKDPSLSQDELNRRVEAFINKFNEDMRLQRQESLNRYMEMINHGAR